MSLEVEKFIGLVQEKRAERQSPFVQNPNFPGLLLRKTGTLARIEREQAEPWENIYDYLNRRYRKDQVPQNRLAKELGLATKTVVKARLHLGIPTLKSDEFKDPKARRLAARWEDPEKKAGLRAAIKETWKREGANQTVHTPGSNQKRSDSLNYYFRQNPGIGAKRIASAHKAFIDERDQFMREKLGNDPATMLRKLRQQGLTYSKIAEFLDVNLYQLRRWADKLGVRGIRMGTHRNRQPQAEIVKSHRGLLDQLPERQARILAYSFPKNGPTKTLQEAANELGITKTGARKLEQRAIAHLSRLARSQIKAD